MRERSHASPTHRKPADKASAPMKCFGGCSPAFCTQPETHHAHTQSKPLSPYWAGGAARLPCSHRGQTPCPGLSQLQRRSFPPLLICTSITHPCHPHPQAQGAQQPQQPEGKDARPSDVVASAAAATAAAGGGGGARDGCSTTSSSRYVPQALVPRERSCLTHPPTPTHPSQDHKEEKEG